MADNTQRVGNEIDTDHGDEQWVSPVYQAALNGYAVEMNIGGEPESNA